MVAGHALLVGSHRLLRRQLGSIPAWAAELVQTHANAGRTPVLVALDGEVRAVAAFADTLRADAARSLVRLRRLGFTLRVLSGDHQRVVDALVSELGVPFESALGGATPEEKLAAYRICDLRINACSWWAMA